MLCGAASSHKVFVILIMALSKVEVNLLRLLEAAPRQQNQAKLVHYVTTARELLEQLGAETTPEGISSVSKAKICEYSEKIEALAARLAVPEPENEMPVDENREVESSYEGEKPGSPISLSSGLRRRPIAHTDVGPSSHVKKDKDIEAPIKLDAEAQAHIEKHRKLQEDLTDEMVELARQLKESSLTMHQSVQETEKILDSTERAVEHSLASTGRATTRAAEVYSLASKTTCFQWLLIFMMTCMFIMVVLLIRGYFGAENLKHLCRVVWC
uniref:Vesicle transport protein USE1 n=1 Tax=Oryza punctata TaxID=4537 RepID=A0A0E0LXB5_ORYPU